MKDKLGKPLKIGDRVAYATLSYKKAHLRFGIIVPHKVPELAKWGDLYVRVKGEDGSISGRLKQPEHLLIVDAAPSGEEVDKLKGSIRFLLCFFEPDKHPHLDTEALKLAVASAKALVTS